MKRISLLFIAILALSAMPALAQSRSVDVTGWVNWVDPSGDDTFEDVNGVDDLDLEFDTAQGYGLGVNVFWSNRVSTEFAAAVVEPDVDLAFTNPALSPVIGSLEMIPLTATLQFHFNPDGRVDPYVGAGAAWVLFDEVQGGIDEVDVDSIDFDDDFGFVVNGGVSIDITEMFAINLDAKYVPVSSSATAVVGGIGSEPFDIDVNPLILSAGLSLQF